MVALAREHFQKFAQHARFADAVIADEARPHHARLGFAPAISEPCEVVVAPDQRQREGERRGRRG